MTNQKQARFNTKGFPLDPTPENLYFYSYSRSERRRHSKAEKEKLLKKIWSNYQNWKKEVDNERVRREAIHETPSGEDQRIEQSGEENEGTSST